MVTTKVKKWDGEIDADGYFQAVGWIKNCIELMKDMPTEDDPHHYLGAWDAAQEIYSLCEGTADEVVAYAMQEYVIAQGDEDKASSVDDCEYYEGRREVLEMFLGMTYQSEPRLAYPSEVLKEFGL